jgi:hypothetical protein
MQGTKKQQWDPHEELGAVCVFPSVGHREQVRLVVLHRKGFIRERSVERMFITEPIQM